jgi:hypothetical protein
MLNTINGFDLLLIIIITILGFKVYNLKQETKSMTTGLTNIMTELVTPVQELVRAMNWELQVKIAADLPKDLYGCVCNYCTDSDPWSSECQDSIGTPPFDKGIYDKVCDYCLGISGSECTCNTECQFTSECACKNCYIRVKPPAEFIRKCTAPDPMKCDCDDCWLIPTKYF